MNEKYIGVKFEVVSLPPEKITDPRIKDLIRVGKALSKKGFCPANSGNLSFRRAGGFMITRAGSRLSKLKLKDFVFVKDVDIKKKKVFSAGSAEPSSEAIMHFMIYAARPAIGAVLHAHAVRLPNAKTTRRTYPYGTLAFAKSAVSILKKNNLAILKDHGFVAVGRTIRGAYRLIA